MPDNTADRAALTPIQLAVEIGNIAGDADCDTALTALEITRLLLIHRSKAQAEFERRCIIGEPVGLE